MRKKQTEKRHKLKVIGYWLLVVVSLFLVGSGFRVFRGFKGAIWDGKGRISLVIANEEVWLVSFAPGKKELVFLEIPKDTEIEVTRGFGRYRIGAVYQLGELEGKGGSLLRESIQEYFGMSIDGYIKIQDTRYKIQDTKSEFLKTLTSLILKRKGLTNFSGWDLLRLWWEIRKVSPYQIEFTRLEEIGALKSKVLVDGSRVWEVEQGRLNMWLQDNFYEPEIREENLTIEVTNTTDHPGLANQVARIIGNMGGRVVEVQSSKFNPFDRLRVDAEQGRSIKVQSSKCEIRSEKKKRETFTVQKLVKALNCQFVEEEETDGRAEVTVLLGEEYWRMLNGK